MPKMIGYQEQVNGMVFIAETTASGSATLAMDIPAGYASVEFHYYNMHPATNQVDFMFQVNAVGQSGFNELINSTAFYSQAGESSGGGLAYMGAYDQANGTSYQALNYETGSDADQSTSGVLTIYDPSNTTYVKHFMGRANTSQSDDFTVHTAAGGYINTTSAIDEISFKFDSGNIDLGTIRMYGVR